MPLFAWIASFVFLGLSISVGLLIYFLFSSKNKGKKDHPRDEGGTTLKDLERFYGKKG